MCSPTSSSDLDRHHPAGSCPQIRPGTAAVVPTSLDSVEPPIDSNYTYGEPIYEKLTLQPLSTDALDEMKYVAMKKLG